MGFAEANAGNRHIGGSTSSRGFPQKGATCFYVWTCRLRDLPAECHREVDHLFPPRNVFPKNSFAYSSDPIEPKPELGFLLPPPARLPATCPPPRRVPSSTPSPTTVLTAAKSPELLAVLPPALLPAVCPPPPRPRPPPRRLPSSPPPALLPAVCPPSPTASPPPSHPSSSPSSFKVISSPSSFEFIVPG